ncbi:ATP:cob(I)alamin adenosyltransferase [Endozoicomonas gorgoniicola]|uniref:ATP:cob(I)alamin adenosyltransferase n=1 Tax=Endozoicomonas gorgoniicola TaxID=1234144 RepID=A0ABT3MPF0_9GAMM|nr:ATP:cob(I)alamin adenosyltransferase [Endozoicomonas gorgoniicola]MCW7551246.1 ATP:cob(I)alamin adenosyltransferase [Endozoicomonas gorgoniicola]
MTEKKQGYRLTRIYTRTGDKGSSRLGDGQVLSKSDARFKAIERYRYKRFAALH